MFDFSGIFAAALGQAQSDKMHEVIRYSLRVKGKLYFI